MCVIDGPGHCLGGGGGAAVEDIYRAATVRMNPVLKWQPGRFELKCVCFGWVEYYGWYPD